MSRSRMRRSHRIAIAFTVIAAGTFVPPALAEIVVLAGGGFLKASAYEVLGERVRLTLASGGELRLPLSRVERIVEDEIVRAPESLDVVAGEDFRLDHDPADPAPTVPYGDQMLAAAEGAGLNPALLAAMARAESAFDADAVSHKGARGLMQVMPATGRRFGADPAALFEPQVNLRAAARYLDWLRDRFEDDLDLILAAYNAGEATVDRYHGVPPYRETREYVRRVRSYLQDS